MGGILLLIALATGLLIYSRWAKAATFSLYPGSCLGSWQNPHLAQGKPEAAVSEISAINKENSTVFSEGGIKEIYCGSFNGDLSENEIKLVKSVNLKFSWLVSDEGQVAATSSITIIQPLATSSEAVAQNTNDVINQILNNIHADEVQVIVSTTTPEITIVTNDTAEQGTDNTGENAAAIATSSPTSFWWRKYNFFSADDQIPNLETEFPSGNSVSIAEATSSLDSPLAPTEDFLKVSYNLDGVNWQALGMVNKNNWQDLSFKIPVYQLEDVKKIQIKIESLPILNKTPFVYLDGMALEVEYETSQNLQSKTASILSQQSNSVSYSSYSRTPNGPSVTGPVSISVSVDSFDDFEFIEDFKYWGIYLIGGTPQQPKDLMVSECIPNTTLSYNFYLDVPPGDVLEVGIIANDNLENCQSLEDGIFLGTTALNLEIFGGGSNGVIFSHTGN